MAKPLKCPRCGRENDPSFSFCLDCGLGLKAAPAAPAGERACAGCGAKLLPGFRFCGHCGRPAEAAPATPSPPPAAPPPPERVAGTAAAAPPPRPPAVPGPPNAPTPRPGPRLSVVRPDGMPGAVFPIDREEIVCGRSGGEVQFPDDPTVSPRHARFTLRQGRVRLEDLGSASGTFVRLRTAQALVPGDEIRVGRQLLRLEPLSREPAEGGVVPWGSPDPGYRMRLVQLLEGGGTGEVFPLKTGENLVGREAGDVVFPADRYVSSRHARVDVAEEGATVTDLGSSNGTFLKVAGAVELAPGVQILVGRQLLRLEP